MSSVSIVLLCPEKYSAEECTVYNNLERRTGLGQAYCADKDTVLRYHYFYKRRGL